MPERFVSVELWTAAAIIITVLGDDGWAVAGAVFCLIAAIGNLITEARRG